jgi:5-methylcytosine-specific restriction endonuclease McrA
MGIDVHAGGGLRLDSLRTLVLNADMQPLSWAPLSSWSWQEAVTAVMQRRVIQLKAYEEVTIRSARAEFEVPAVVCLRRYHQRRAVPFTRFNLFLRDEFRCQYCGCEETAKNLTFDHVIPRSRGGRGGFGNIVAACQVCNLKKGNRTPERAGMKLRRPPRVPSPAEIDRVGRRLAVMHKDLHRTWLDFLYWDSEIAED